MNINLKQITVGTIVVWLSYIFIMLLMLFVLGCDIQKQALKNKTTTDQKNDINKEAVTITEESSKGGTVKASILPESQREKDENGFYKELIQKLTDGGATQTVYYKPDGTVDLDCTADEIWKRIESRLIEKDNSTTTTDTVQKEKEKTENFDSSIILYVMLGLAFMVLIVSFFGFKLLNKNTQALTAVLEKISN